MTPVGIILCSSAGQNIVRYTLDNLPSKVLAKEYRPALAVERRIAEGMKRECGSTRWPRPRNELLNERTHSLRNYRQIV